MRCRKPGDIGFTKTSQTPCSIRLVVHEPEIFARPQENSGKSRPLRAFGHIGSITHPKKPLCPLAHQRCRQIGGWRQERKSCGSHNVCCRNGLWQAGWRVFRPRRVPRHMVRTTHHFFFLFPSACWGSDWLGALAATACRAAETANLHLLRPRRLGQKEDGPPRHGAAEEQRKPSRREAEEKRIRAEEQTTRGKTAPLKASGCSARAANGLRQSGSGKVATARLGRLDAASPAMWLGR